MTAQNWLNERLTSDQQHLLSHQGFVAAEQLPSGRSIYKLRFRDAERRQRVLYIGAAPQLAQALADRLTELQAQRRGRAVLRQAMAAALAAQRQGRRQLAPVLAEHGYHFHGFSLRRTRCAPAPPHATGDPGRARRSLQR
jgi:hypothetical protein